MERITLDKLQLDPAIQPRATMDMITIQEYAEDMRNSAEFPPIEVVFDGSVYWVWDGFHRVSAAISVKIPWLYANVKKGKKSDAQWLAYGANKSHGLRRKNEDKRRAVELALQHPRAASKSTRELAEHCGVAHSFVHKLKHELSVLGEQIEVTRNGQTYTMDTSRIGKQDSQPPVDNRPLFADDPDLDSALDDESKPVCQNCGQVYDGASCPDCRNEQPVQPELPTPARFICGDFASIASEIEPGSIDVIITDPPYPKEFLHLYELLAKQAAKLLKPGGSLLAMCGQSYLPDIMALMTPHIAYHWTLSYQTPGGQSPQIWPKKVNTFWKPVLWFVKGEYGGLWHGDVIKSDVNDNDKRFHEWGQSESGIARLVNDHSLPGDLILDPFCGGGTTGAVAVALSRRFIGIDKDPVAIETSKKRLANGH